MRTANPAYKKGVSLFELLAVMALLAILMVLSVPAARSLMDAQVMNQVAQDLSGTLGLARQAGLASSRPVQLRLIRPGAASGEPENYSRLQVVKARADGRFEPVANASNLPDNIILATSPTFSTLMTLPEVPADAQNDPSLPGLGTDYHYRAVVFRPNGSTSLPPGDRWFVTAINLRDDGGTEPPSNFVTAVIDPVTGSPTIYRP
jgi:uncharacterized protein (TIGR02596 family)